MATPAVPAPLQQLPNALTVARLGLIPVFALLEIRSNSGYSWAAAIVFGVAGVTDQIDGFLARRWHVESAFGTLADPLADRLMIGAAVILLWLDERLPWVALAIPLRDLVALAATPLVLGRGYEFRVNILGKIATWLLYLSLGFLMVTHKGAGWPLTIFWIGVGLAVVSLAQYVAKAKRETS
jgi:CDP-diacylglycerol--glycerol-3-phosphate 3-phosphatidyltransferase